MFTGIVAAVGTVLGAPEGRLAIRHRLPGELVLGGSVAVNGVCLTVVERAAGAFSADVVPETRRRTGLGRLGAGDPVNLELPLRADQGLDGHLVQGHVDAAAEVLAVAEAGLGREVVIGLPAELAGFVAEKGSIAVDGVSLTVAAVSPGSFTAALIPHTLENTIAGGYRPGSIVNLEVDVVARYVERLLGERSR